MKNFKMIEKKDPYENATASRISARDFVNIKKLIIFSRCSFVGFIIFIFFIKSSLCKSLTGDIIENKFLFSVLAFIILYMLVMMFVISLPCFYEIIKFFYNLIIKRVIGVDSYYDIAVFSEYLFEKFKNLSNENFEYDDYEFDEYEDEFYDDDEFNECEYNSQVESNIVYVDFSSKIGP